MRKVKIISILFLGMILILLANSAKSELLSKKQYLCVQGYLDPNSEKELFLSSLPFVLDYPLFDPPGEESQYTIEILDTKGSVITKHTFGTSPMTVIMDDGDRTIDSGMFAFSIPFSSEVNKILIKKNEVILYEQIRSPNPPTVRIIKPKDNSKITGIVDIEWIGRDRDGDCLFYRLESSNDSGKNWTPETSFIQAQNIKKEVEYFHAKEKLLLRIICSDGFNTAVDLIKVLVE